ncbi:MAG: hemerythrin domain-containing protein [Myxococcales bacterium]
MERSVANKVATQHKLLKSQTSAAHSAIEGGQSSEAARRVERLARTLELHLTLEEEHYFPQMRTTQPHLADELDRLLVEHVELRDVLRKVIDLLSGDDLSGGGAPVRAEGAA